MKDKSKNIIGGLSRRAFCKTSTLAAGGVLASPLIANANFFSSASDKIKIAVVGCGGRGTGAASQALTADDSVQLVAMADAFRDRLDSSYSSLSQKYAGSKDRINVKEKHKFTGFDAYKKAIDLADVVILATPPGFRPLHFEYAVNAGKHIFMEKPVATDVAGIKRVLKAAELAKQKQLNVVVGLQRHYQNNYREIARRVEQGEIGDIVSGQVYWNSAGVWVRERKPEQTELEYQMRNWYYFNWLCGDHILEQHIHNIDVANWFIGDYPVSAQGMGGREVRNGKDHGQIFDHHFVEFTYPNGAKISSQCRHQPNTMSRVDEVFQGTKGNVYVSGNNSGNIKSYNGSTIYDHRGKSDPNPYQVEHDELFAAIKKGEVINNAEYGARSTMTAILGRMATYSGQVITWDDAFASDMQLVPDNLNWDSQAPVLPDEEGNYPVPVPGITKPF
jgi:myo-inositol 2-dehydrogenase/D-chiro-inositol 1-dehydrogenase